MFDRIDPSVAKLHEVTVREVLDAAQQTIGTAFPGAPLTERPIRHTMSMIYRDLGRYDLALPNSEAEVRLAQAGYGGKDHPEFPSPACTNL